MRFSKNDRKENPQVFAPVDFLMTAKIAGRGSPRTELPRDEARDCQRKAALTTVARLGLLNQRKHTGNQRGQKNGEKSSILFSKSEIC